MPCNTKDMKFLPKKGGKFGKKKESEESAADEKKESKATQKKEAEEGKEESPEQNPFTANKFGLKKVAKSNKMKAMYAKSK